MPNAQHINNALAAAYFESNDGMETLPDIGVFLSYCEIMAGNDYSDKNLDKMLSEAADSYAGTFDSFTELAEHFIDEGLLGDIPEHLVNYIDAEKFGNDLRLGGDYWEENKHFFRNC